MNTYYATLNIVGIIRAINELRKARGHAQAVEMEAFVACTFFSIIGVPGLGVTGPAAALAWAAALACATSSYQMDYLGDMATLAIEKLESYKDVLQGGIYDLIKVRVKAKPFPYHNYTYYIPTSFDIISIHAKHGGWALA